MTPEEKQEILDICNSEEFASKTPIEIVPILADRGIYVASESTFYKVLKEAKQLAHRGREKRKHDVRFQPTKQPDLIRCGCGISHT